MNDEIKTKIFLFLFSESVDWRNTANTFYMHATSLRMKLLVTITAGIKK